MIDDFTTRRAPALPTKPTRDATTTPRQQLRDGTAIGIRWAIIGLLVCEAIAVVKYWSWIVGWLA